MKKVLLPIAGTIIFILVFGFWAKSSGLSITSTTSSQSSPAPLKTMTVGDKNISVEIADTQAKRELGLSNRPSLPKDQGMLFIFDKKQVFVNFWMKDMQFPLDMIWISNDKVIRIDYSVPVEKGVGDKDLTVYSPQKPVDYVLEVNSGFAKNNRITVGSSVNLPTGS